MNPNTVAGLPAVAVGRVLETVRVTGLEVTSTALKHCRSARLNLIRDHLRQAFTEAKQSGINPTELRDLVEVELAAGPPSNS